MGFVYNVTERKGQYLLFLDDDGGGGGGGDMSKYQLKSNISQDPNATSATTYPSSKALSDGLDSVKPTLFDIKIMSERIASKGWSCISYDTQNKLNKADVPTAYDFIKEKYDNVDGAMSVPTIAGGKPQLFYGGYYYYSNGSDIYRSPNIDLSSSVAWKHLGWNANLSLLELNNTTYMVSSSGSFIYIINLSTEEVVSQYQTSKPMTKVLSKINQKTIVINNNGYLVTNYGSTGVLIFKIASDLTITEVFSIARDSTVFTDGITPSVNANSSDIFNYLSVCSFDNKIYFSRSGIIFWYDPETNTYDYYRNVLPYGTEISAEKYIDWGHRLFVYNNKLSSLNLDKTGNYLYLLQLNNNVWELVKTIDVSSSPIHVSLTTSSFQDIYAFAIIDNFFWFVVKDKTVTSTVKVYKTNNFDNSNFTEVVTNYSYPLQDLIYNNGNYIYTDYEDGHYVYSGYLLTIYTDTYTIDGNSVAVKYYKNGDWKICIPDIAVGNDTNLQTVYDYLSYLNYWWIDTTNEKIALPRNSNRWSFMYVDDDYDKEVDGTLVLPTGISTRLLPQSELIEISSASITLDILANKVYKFTNSEITDITFSTVEDSDIPTSIKFTTGNTAPTFTDNSGITWVDGTPVFQANYTYQIIIFGKDGYVKEF